MNMFAVLTQYCNLSCAHCYLPSIPHRKGVPDDLTESKFRQSIDNISSFVGFEIDDIYLTGGEFLLLSYGVRVVELVRAAFPNATVFAYTNGLLFQKNPALFEHVRPDVFHVGLDDWHGQIGNDGQSAIAELFISHMNTKETRLLFHWTRRQNDDRLFEAFFARYCSTECVEIEDRGLNTTTGRASKFKRPQYREDEFWRSCSLGEHVLLKFDGHCYGCQFGIPWSNLGNASSVNVKTQLSELRESPIGKTLRGNRSEEFYRYLCKKYEVEFTRYSCILCEELTYSGVDIIGEAKHWLGQEETADSSVNCRTRNSSRELFLRRTRS